MAATACHAIASGVGARIILPPGRGGGDDCSHLSSIHHCCRLYSARERRGTGSGVAALDDGTDGKARRARRHSSMARPVHIVKSNS